MRNKKKISFIELVQKNKNELLNNNKEIERIEKRIDQRHEIDRYKQK
ncbi:FbpB family small basic protein [Neobacillus sp. KR4-4]